jgi:septal ring factor EnvC (AmiA/AmiB activator)
LSPLTKIFVILLVIFSLLLTAGTVTFVNTQQEFSKTLKDTKALADAKVAEAANAQASLTAEKARSDEAIRTATAQIEAMKNENNRTQQAIADRDVKLAAAGAEKAMTAANIASLTEALKASEDSRSKQQEQLAALRTSSDQIQTQNAALNTQINDLTNRLDVTERDRRFLAEQNAELKQQGEKASAALKDAGIDINAVAGGTRAGAPNVTGVVRSVRNIANLPYATISVGSSDNVTKGMEFRVVDRDAGKFLGTLTVDSVEPNEATGRLSGPRVNDIKPGTEVRTAQ